MKHSIYFGLLLGSILLFASCNEEKEESNSQSDTSKDASEDSDVEEMAHEKNEPFLFPFGLELEHFEPKGYRTSCGGDCCSMVKVLEKGAYAVFLDTTDCWEYGYDEKYLLFRGDELIACHQKGFDMGEFGDGFNYRERMERTIDFENEKVFIRRDTVKNTVKKWITKDFSEENYSSAMKGEVQKYLDDPRVRRSFESKDDFSINHSKVEMKSTPVNFFNHFQPDYDIEILNAYSLQEVSNRKNIGIPKNALFAYSTWYAGGGDLIYGALNDGVLQIWYSYEDEGLSEVPPYELFLEIDPDVTKYRPNHYIVFDPDKGGKNQLMLGMNEKDVALYAKYKGQARHIELRKISSKVDGKK
ncbi:MAG: hypothetical protein NXI10_13695 [bacterium]|nr:hypothetical protein [bacterium]